MSRWPVAARAAVRRGLSAAVAALLAVVALTVMVAAVPAGAAGAARSPGAPDGVVRLHLVAVAKPAAAYELTVSWRAGPDTSSYRVRATDARGAVLDSATVTATTWRAEVDAVARQEVTIAVTPYHGRARGRTSTLGTTLPDLTPPTASFETARDGRTVTLTRTGLSDDVSPRRQIRSSVAWGDGTRREPWTGGSSISHRYPGPGRWVPRVRLVDAEGNAAVVPAAAVVVGDDTAPTGAFSASPTASWATLTRVGLTQLRLRDDGSAPEDIARVVEWGDGTSTAWPAGAPVEHVYATSGVFTPAVRLTDEAGNQSVVSTNPVTVSRDDEAPTVRLHRPRANPQAVASWDTVEGRATDDGTGTAIVLVQVAQQREDGWYAYRPGGQRWVPAAGLRAAWHRARPALILPTRAGRWLCPVRSLQQGLLVVRVTARDNVGNTSERLVHRRRLVEP